MRIRDILSKEDRELLNLNTDGDVGCPICKRVWHTPYKRGRRICPECFEKHTGSKYVD